MVGVPGPDGMNDAQVGAVDYQSWQWARMTVQYKRFTYDPTSQAGELSIEYGNTVTTTPRGDGSPAFQYKNAQGKVTGQVPAADTPALRIGTATLVLTKYNCASCGSALAFQLGGMVNSDSWQGAAPGTLLFDGVSSDKQTGIGGANTWTNKIRVIWNSVGWNKLYHPSINDYEDIFGVTDGEPPFNTTSFSVLSGYL